MKKFSTNFFTIKILSKVSLVFFAGMLLRFLINDLLNTEIFIELLHPIIIVIGSILHFLFIESWLHIHCKFYGYGLGFSHIKNGNYSNTKNSYNYIQQPTIIGRATLNMPSDLSNYNIDSNTRKRIASQLFEEIAQPTKFREVFVPLNNGTGNVILGIRFHDKPSNAYGLYVKYRNLFNQEYIWDVWDRDSSYLRFSDIRDTMHPSMHIWKQINDVTGANISKEVRKILKNDAFEMYKSK